ncbi:MAG: DNA polymerase III subunit alpha, partial [Gammaproteobacteria bacterium]|nr:DNA polymerase III subunit alpha [Gammaproteobacteria bacterium]
LDRIQIGDAKRPCHQGPGARAAPGADRDIVRLRPPDEVGHDIPVGPGRGSGAGSLVAWALGITDLDPIKHALLFERFLNPERVSMPDFDIDFCMEGRDRVIDYVAEHYGRDRVSQIITYGTMAAKAVVRDAGRVLGHPFGFVDRVAKLIPFEIGMTLDKALQQEADLRDLYGSDDDVRAIIDLARRLEGLVRNAGKHAGGVVIAPSAITDFTPLFQVEGEKGTVTQFDKDDVEAAGLVKFDFLGLRTLTIIDRAVKTINQGRAQAGENALDIRKIPMDDAAAFRLLQQCRTTAVFQLESRGMRELVKRLKPDQFEDIVALVALYRPGPLQSGMVEDFIARKHGDSNQPIDYLHPDLQPVLEETYGVILYQEQVMQIAQRLAGYSLGEADLLRRAMGKKKPEEMAKQGSVFLEGAVKRGVDRGTAQYIFDLMEKFAGYGFNKSHSAAYALLSYQTAWLKAHYPAAFLSAVMSSEMDDTDKLTVLKRDCEAEELQLLPPDVNDSGLAFEVRGTKAIRYGLGAIKGLGRSAVELLLVARADGPFQGLDDLCQRVESQRFGRRALEALIKSGALDAFAPNRPSLLAALPTALGRAEQIAHARASGQEDMFGEAASPALAREQTEIPVLEDWGIARRLEAERESLGLYLSGHPFDQYRTDGPFVASGTIAALIGVRPPGANGNGRQAGRDVSVAGVVTGLRKRGGRVTLELDDGQDRIEVTLFQESFDRFRHLLVSHAIVVISGSLRYDDFIDGWRLTAKDVTEIDRLIEKKASGLVIRWREARDGKLDPERLKSVLEPFRPGRCGVHLYLERGDAEARVQFGDAWAVRPSSELREKLSAVLGVDGFRFVYDAPPA